MIRVALVLSAGRRSRIRCSHLDPAAKIVNLSPGELPILRHANVLVRLEDQLDQQTLAWFAGYDRRTRLAALHQRLTRIKSQSTPLFPAAVTFETLRGKERTNISLEEPNLFRSRLRLRGLWSQQHRTHQQGNHPSTPRWVNSNRSKC